MTSPEPRKGRCWFIFHDWSQWGFTHGRSWPGYQVKTCLRCGRGKGRFSG